MYSPSRARDMATIKRRTSRMWPTVLVLTRERRMKSFCWPWKRSTVVTFAGRPKLWIILRLYKMSMSYQSLDCSHIGFQWHLWWDVFDHCKSSRWRSFQPGIPQVACTWKLRQCIQLQQDSGRNMAKARIHLRRWNRQHQWATQKSSYKLSCLKVPGNPKRDQR